MSDDVSRIRDLEGWDAEQIARLEASYEEQDRLAREHRDKARGYRDRADAFYRRLVLLKDARDNAGGEDGSRDYAQDMKIDNGEVAS